MRSSVLGDVLGNAPLLGGIAGLQVCQVNGVDVERRLC